MTNHLIEWLVRHQYEIGVGSGLLLAMGLTGLFALMVVIWPNTRLKALTLWFIFWLCAVMWRWIGAVLKPDLFGIRESLLAAGIFLMAGLTTFILMGVAWFEYVRDGRNGQDHEE